MKFSHVIALVAASLPAAAFGPAPTLTVTATNRTTGRPAAGDVVVLVSLVSGMDEIGRGKLDGGGRFRFTVAGNPAPRLVRVLHDSVAYHAIAPAGASSMKVEVYDAAAKLEGVIATRHLQRFQTGGETLQVIEEISVRNASHPPRTLMNERPFEIQLPPGAEIVAAAIQARGQQPIARKPTPVDSEGRYSFDFPLRPGDTRFAVAYKLPYSGEALIEPGILLAATQFAVVLPRSMKFEAKTPGAFRAIRDRAGVDVQVASAVRPGQSLAFRISGTGTMPATQGGPPTTAKFHGDAGQGDTAGRAPTLAAVPPQLPPTYRWVIFGGLGLVLAAVTVGVARARKHSRERSARISTWRQHKRVCA